MVRQRREYNEKVSSYRKNDGKYVLGYDRINYHHVGSDLYKRNQNLKTINSDNVYVLLEATREYEEDMKRTVFGEWDYTTLDNLGEDLYYADKENKELILKEGYEEQIEFVLEWYTDHGNNSEEKEWREIIGNIWNELDE